VTALSAADLLAAWERAAGLPPGARALALLSALGEPAAPDLPAGERDRKLAAAYRGLFGRRAVARVECPACAAAVELDLDLDEFAREAGPPPDPVLHLGGCEVAWRSPTAADLAAVARHRDPAAAYEDLLRRCVVSVSRGGEPVGRGEWPEGVAGAVAEAVGRADPLAAAEVGLECPACGHRWSAGFDVGVFLWAELKLAAHRLMTEVHKLASAYGWSEADVLSMTATRRAAYLGLCGG
jgi:hypothetical protein